MTQQRGKKIGLPHPAVTFAAAGLLLGVTFNEMIRPAPRTSGALGHGSVLRRPTGAGASRGGR